MTQRKPGRWEVAYHQLTAQEGTPMNLRQQLAEARASLRTAKDALETAKTVATLEVSGRNEAERKSNTALALLKNDAYTYALVYVRDCEALVERVEAEIAEQEYQLRVREVATRERTEEEHALRLREVAARERLAEALLGKKVDDAAIDSLSRVEAAQRRGYAPVDTTEWYGR